MTPEDIVVDSKTPEGTRALRDYLAYARNGILPQTLETEAEPDSDFEVAVIDVLKGEGYEVTPQLGVAGFRLDIAVRHPDYPSTYLAAIECDGATYHSGVSVRDRDRIRQEILESIGWRHRIWRIWSTDWFRNPRAESEKLFAFLATCRALSIPAEYAVEEAIEEQASEPLSDALDQELDFEFDAGEVDLEVAVGDIVTYSPSDSPDNKLTVKITQHQTDPSQGLVARHTPLSQTLLGATVGETVVLRVPAMPTQALLVHEISRQQKQEAG
jgi:transcription elongation GreA/GreB family factor